MKYSACSSSLIDSESNHIRHFNKIPFIYKGIDFLYLFIDLPNIFQDKSVTESIPVLRTYFQNSEPPSICYKYNIIRNNINNFVSDLDIHANTPKC